TESLTRRGVTESLTVDTARAGPSVRSRASVGGTRGSLPFRTGASSEIGERRGSVDPGGWVDAVALVGAALAHEVAGRAPRATARRGPGRGAEVPQDLAGHGGIVDRGHQAHRAATPGAHQNLEAPRSLQQHRPGEATIARGCVG